ncbi:MAG TPA: hypothetical protein VL523_07050 [Terriglobia bacterium]|nr:hypothetical protein [Terriglobia bacterium]
MARGWESKAVESQMESAGPSGGKPTPGRLSVQQMERLRERNSLELAKVRVQHDLAGATHPGHRAALEAALRHLDEKIASLA